MKRKRKEEKVVIMAAAVATIGAAAGFLLYQKIRENETRVSQIPRTLPFDKNIDRENFIKSILYCGDTHCLNQIRMRPTPFFKLCTMLKERKLLTSTVNMTVIEQVVMFLHILGHNVRFRAIGGRFYRSTWTIHYYFHRVLDAILSLHPEFVNRSSSSTPSKILNSTRFYPWFEDCIGALDGTHVRASVPTEDQDRFRNRKGFMSQNVLAAVSFDDLKFTYVLAGWEGSAHDC